MIFVSTGKTKSNETGTIVFDLIKLQIVRVLKDKIKCDGEMFHDSCSPAAKVTALNYH